MRHWRKVGDVLKGGEQPLINFGSGWFPPTAHAPMIPWGQQNSFIPKTLHSLAREYRIPCASTFDCYLEIVYNLSLFLPSPSQKSTLIRTKNKQKIVVVVLKKCMAPASDSGKTDLQTYQEFLPKSQKHKQEESAFTTSLPF
uniref:Uncharacterized protein n=1 Tax=Sphaerodactylus townsendi TaxID=933632 RepID=A0ACB8GAC6_9SAUR